jgi:outer membrane protein insertion porin family
LVGPRAITSTTVSYDTKTVGGSGRLGFALREDLSMQLRYSLYRQEVSIDSTLQNCNNNRANTALSFNPTPAYAAANGIDLSSSDGLGCYSDSETSLPVKIELANGPVWTSATSAIGASGWTRGSWGGRSRRSGTP